VGGAEQTNRQYLHATTTAATVTPTKTQAKSSKVKISGNVERILN
jgi:hypothetical protein